jgi:hypothetical protein
MGYTPEQVNTLLQDLELVSRELRDLQLEGLVQYQASDNKLVRDQLAHGVGRRVSVIQKSIEQIFHLFPPHQTTPLRRDVLTSVQIFLHSCVMNVSGVFDNWAWAFLFRHGLERRVRDRQSVSLFKEETQKFLPATLREYLQSGDIATWHEKYLKGYRDALAHRIPLYIPPATWTDEDKARYERLEAEKVECIRKHEWDRIDAISDEQDGIGRPCFMFLHEFSADEDAKPVVLHPQVICDGKTVVDFGKRFYAHWHEHS